MKTGNRIRRWGPAAGVVAIGIFAFSMSLEGAPAPGKAGDRAKSSVKPEQRGTVSARDATPGKSADEGRIATPAPAIGTATGTVPDRGQSNLAGIKFGHMPKGDLPVLPEEVVDYTNDEGTRLRQAGLLVGPYRPHVQAVAAGTACLTACTGAGVPFACCTGAGTGTCVCCSFDINCDDCDPCTQDTCNIPVGAAKDKGVCVITPLNNGQEGECSDGLCCNGRETCQGGVCQQPGAGTGIFDISACQYPCSGGTVCNEDSNLCRPPCNGTNFCAVDGLPCTDTTKCNSGIVNNYCLNCQDGLKCNGTETCVNQRCETSTNPCGPNALCGEKDCSAGGVQICTTDSDCAGNPPLGTCSIIGPICQYGRCCNNTLPAGEPECTKRYFSGPLGVNVAARCAQAVTGGVWFATDGRYLTVPGGNVCPTPALSNDPNAPVNDRTLCPKYSSGIAPAIDFDTEAAFIPGPFSDSPCDHHEIGDDYRFENGKFMALEKLRWVGGGGGRLTVELYDEFGNLIEDIVTGGIGGGGTEDSVAVRSVRFVPTLTIPSKGYVVITVASQFAPNGRTYWVATGGLTATPFVGEVDEGINDNTKLWIDGGPVSNYLKECFGGTQNGAWCDPSDPGDSNCVNHGGTCQTRPDVLAFEMEGLSTDTTGPRGACCTTSGSVSSCDVKLPWECDAAGGSFAGAPSECFTCDSGPVGSCGRCVGGPTPGADCQSDVTCGTGGDCQSAAVCTMGGVCVTNAFCDTGACCHADGTCTTLSETACTAGSGTFQGFGTSCVPNCCPQPVTTGGNNCENTTLIAGRNLITVPAVGAPALTVTLTGNNATASGPDSCQKDAFYSGGGTVLTVDPGWWETFSIDKCAFVRVDFCCSVPTVEPQWSYMYKGCPCDVAVFNAVNPNVPGEAANFRGPPYCPFDDNLWVKYGPLPAGQYYQPVYSLLQGRGGLPGPYQMHITVEACPTAACCNGSTCQDKNQLDCAAIDGANFLAPPYRTVPTTTCQGSTCATGSCCYDSSGNTCEDIISSQLATQTLCTQAQGIYRGGARCKGGVCSEGSPPRSCASDTDCPSGGCLCNGVACTATSPEALQPSPCPICDFQSTPNCQLSSTYHGARLSDKCVGDCKTDPPLSQFSVPTIRVADDFVAATGGDLTSVCVWGIYGDQNDPLGNLADCSQLGPPEKFTVKIYNDQGGLPGTVKGTSATHVTRKGDAYISGTRHIIQWQLHLDTPITNFAQDVQYWLEVVNDTDESSGPIGCDWFWAYADPQLTANGNFILLQDAGSAYTFDDAVFDNDQAWCLTIANRVPALIERACCTCGGGIGTCSVSTLSDCILLDGQWYPADVDCIGVVCRNSADAADNCATQKIAVASDTATPWNNLCTNTDGPDISAVGPPDAQECTAPLSLQNDLWFTWTSDCNGNAIFETCDLGGEIDSVMTVYSNGTGTCICPTTSASQLDCSDDGCVFSGRGSRITVPATTGTCYTIRVGGFNGIKGQGVLHVTGCSAAPLPATPVADPSGKDKTRFISFTVPSATTAAAGETALRVKMTSLHHVSPAYTGGTGTPFTVLETKEMWVGPPVKYTESGSSPPSTDFYASVLQCTPHYQVWNTVGLLTVTGEVIVPSSTYNVENLAADCLNQEGTAPCQSGGTKVSTPLQITTTRWADVELPYQDPLGSPSQPDFTDIGALKNKFAGAGPIKARTLLAGDIGTRGLIDISAEVNFTDISLCVDAFQGKPYPYKPGKCTTGGAACGANTDCAGITGPCILCP